MLPEDYKQFSDKYFIRTRIILEGEGLNPFVLAQVFIRVGPGKVAGMKTAVEIIKKYSKIQDNGGHLYILGDGMDYSPCETLMIIMARIQDIVELETLYLGVLSEEITKLNDKIDINLGDITRTTESIVNAVQGKPVYYGGARHWGFYRDAEIAKAAFNGGAAGCSTDAGAATVGMVGMGTINHALENIMAWKYGYSNAVVEAILAFDRHIDPIVPRFALVDYANKEIDDSLTCAIELGDRLKGIRVDTCGENLSQNASLEETMFEKDLLIPEEDKKFWFGRGVTVSSACAIRETLNKNGFNNVDIMVSSGFGNPDKCKAFSRAEDILQMRLFDSVLVGGIFESRATTMDIVEVGVDPDHMKPFVKVGRKYRPNPRLRQVF